MEHNSISGFKRPVHIIVGAGAAGILCAHELSKTSDIYLLEAGSLQANTHHDSIDPLRWGAAWVKDCEAIRRVCVAQEGLLGRSILCPAGTGIGGSTNINAMIWNPGHRAVFDRYWPEEWNSMRMEKLFSRVKSIVEPVKTSRSGVVEAAVQSSVVNECDSQGVWDDGALHSSYYTTTTAGTRTRLGDLLSPLISARTLRVLANTTVHGVLLEQYGTTEDSHLVAIGVYMTDSRGKRVLLRTENGGEVILCSGVWGSPSILRHSIVLPPESIDPGVTQEPCFCTQGQLLQDDGDNDISHCDTIIAQGIQLHVRTEEAVEYSKKIPMSEIGKRLMDHTVLPFITFGSWRNLPHVVSESSLPSNGIHGWVNLDCKGDPVPANSSTPPSIQLVYVDGRVLPGLIAEMVLPRLEKFNFYSYYVRPFFFSIIYFISHISLVQQLLSMVLAVLVCNVQPQIQGRVASNVHSRFRKHVDPVVIDLNYGLSKCDMEITKCGLAAARRSVNVASTSGLWYTELLPGPLFGYAISGSLFQLYYKLFLTTYFHFCGTCRMTCSSDEVDKTESALSTDKSNSSSQNSKGVVDVYLRVSGAEKLRIADASVFPSIPSAPIAATCMAIGLGVADLVNNTVE